MSAKAELVRQISTTGFTEAIDLMACLAVLRESDLLGNLVTSWRMP